MRTLVIGDIHGNYKALKQCLGRSNFDYNNNLLIQLGDIADGWHQVPECIDELLKIRNLIAIRGNHDAWCDQWMQSGNPQGIWLNQGGAATYEAYMGKGLPIDPKHKRFFRSQHRFYIDTDRDMGFVHGGFSAPKGLGHEIYESDYWWDRDLWHYHSKTTPPFPSLSPYKKLFIGHTQTSRDFPDLKPVYKHGIWNLDQGAGWLGKLTIMDIDTEEYWQSDTADKLYPRLRGR